MAKKALYMQGFERKGVPNNFKVPF